MKRFVIERDIPGVGALGRDQYKGLAQASHAAIAKLGAGQVQWVHSYVTGDKTFCIYLGESEALIREHSRLAGFPVTRITEAPLVLDPMAAFS